MKGNAGEGQETQEILKKHENNRKALKNHKIKNSNNNQKHKNPGIMSGKPWNTGYYGSERLFPTVNEKAACYSIEDVGQVKTVLVVTDLSVAAFYTITAPFSSRCQDTQIQQFFSRSSLACIIQKQTGQALVNQKSIPKSSVTSYP